MSDKKPWSRPKDHPEHVAWQLLVDWANESPDPAPRPRLGLSITEQYADLMKRIASAVQRAGGSG